MNRRDFLIHSSRATAAGVVGLNLMGKAMASPNDTIRVAVVGFRGRGMDHIGGFSTLPNVQVVALCDVDESVRNKAARQMESRGLRKPKTYVDIRKMLEDKDIDVVSVATPNHWHSLMGIWSCQAGKDVYMEKPCSHNLWEGHQLVAAAHKYNRIVQHGTQSRSTVGAQEAMQKLREGVVGDIYMARAVVFKWRGPIGRTPEEPVPAGVDYDLWLGPAPKRPFSKNRFHYNWHWHWDYGNGDIGNQAPHEIDLARWGLGVRWPVKVSSMGGHFMFDDDQETPNTQLATFEFDDNGKKKMLVVDVRHWITNEEAHIGENYLGGGHRKRPTAPKPATPPTPPQPQGAQLKPAPQGGSNLPSAGLGPGGPAWVGDIWYGSNGYLVMDGYDTYYSFIGKEHAPGPQRHEGGNHYENFIKAVRSRKTSDLNAPIEEGHITAGLMHLANASYRLGRTLRFDPKTETVVNDEEANRMLRGTYRAPFTVPEKV